MFARIPGSTVLFKAPEFPVPEVDTPLSDPPMIPPGLEKKLFQGSNVAAFEAADGLDEEV